LGIGDWGFGIGPNPQSPLDYCLFESKIKFKLKILNKNLILKIYFIKLKIIKIKNVI